MFFCGGVKAHKINTARNKFSNIEAVGGPVVYKCSARGYRSLFILLNYVNK